jgi:predicted Zn-dependent protease with MMP-like domain
MTKIALLPERTDDITSWRAIAGDKQAVGQTAGEALDAISAQLSDEDSGTLIIVQNRRPDEFFNQQQSDRPQFLMGKWREARDCDRALGAAEQAELEALVEAEVDASTKRATAAFRARTP